MAEETNANPSAKRRGLGKGLGALIVNTDPETLETLGPAKDAQRRSGSSGVMQIPISSISANPHQPRTQFDEESLAELAASIREHGVIQPLVVTDNPEDLGAYWLITGERRWRASQLAELESVPAIVRDATPRDLLELALVENVQRADLNALEEAAAYQLLIDQFNLKQEDVARRVGRSRSAVANTVRLLNLPQDVQQALIDGELTAGHARALLALPDEAMMSVALERITSNGLNVRQTEELVRTLLQPAKEEPTPANPATRQSTPDAYLQDLEGQFRDALGTRVNLNRNKNGSGRLVVHFYNDDDLQELYERFVEGRAD